MADKRSTALRITDLPETALFRVFDLAGKEHGQSICLVCKSWNELYFRSPGLWRSLVLGSLPAARSPCQLAAWLAAKRCLLQKLGSLVKDVDAKLVDPSETIGPLDAAAEAAQQQAAAEEEHASGQLGVSLWQGVKALLLALPPSVSTLRLMLQCSQARAAGLVLPSLPALAQLHLEAPLAPGSSAVQPVVVAWLPRLPQLRGLSWSSAHANLSPQLVGAIGRLSGLTALHLQLVPKTRGKVHPTAAAAIAGLTALQDLAVDANGLPAGLVTSAAALPHLTALSLGGLPTGTGLGRLTALSKLRKLSLTTADHVHQPEELPAPAAFPALSCYRAAARHKKMQLKVAGASVNACCWDADTAGSLSLKGLMGTISWAELLSALRPPAGTAPLRTLCLEESELTAEALHGCLPLPGVTQLRLASCTAVRGLGPKVPVSGEAAGALLRTVPHLRSLTLHHCLKGEFPEQLASMSGLSKVELSSNGLSSYSIPTGPWLADLKVLCLANNHMGALPPVLSNATALTELELGSDSGTCMLDAKDADVLAPLKQLQKLSCPKGEATRAFRERLPALQLVGVLPEGERHPRRTMQTARMSTGSKAPAGAQYPGRTMQTAPMSTGGKAPAGQRNPGRTMQTARMSTGGKAPGKRSG